MKDDDEPVEPSPDDVFVIDDSERHLDLDALLEAESDDG